MTSQPIYDAITQRRTYGSCKQILHPAIAARYGPTEKPIVLSEFDDWHVIFFYRNEFWQFTSVANNVEIDWRIRMD